MADKVPFVYVNALAPESLQAILTCRASALDLSTVTAVSFKVQKPDLTTAIWAGCTLGPAVLSADGIRWTRTATYGFAGGDVAQAGAWKAMAVMTVPGGTIRTQWGAFTALAEFN